MTSAEQKEMRRLHGRWATGKATTKEMLRCMELDRQAKKERAEAAPPPGPVSYPASYDHVRDLAHEAEVMKARLDNLLVAAKAVLAARTESRLNEPHHPAMVAAMAQLRRAVDRAALPIEAPEEP